MATDKKPNHGNDGEEDELARLAREEILADTKRARTRAETLGATGWRPCPLPKTNKRFFHNMLIGTVQANRQQGDQEKGDLNGKQQKQSKRSEISKDRNNVTSLNAGKSRRKRHSDCKFDEIKSTGGRDPRRKRK